MEFIHNNYLLVFERAIFISIQIRSTPTQGFSFMYSIR